MDKTQAFVLVALGKTHGGRLGAHLDAHIAEAVLDCLFARNALCALLGPCRSTQPIGRFEIAGVLGQVLRQILLAPSLAPLRQRLAQGRFI
ncbi:hypothetical protein, partial [uncultured Limnohabitans sp.]|uniref:hypothetical protein n=1 Tax=uncultured Limnohabitans sp. TaxID=768543 RepID=UPI002611F468